MSRSTLTGGAARWGRLAVTAYLLVVGLPVVTLMLYVWVATGADAVAEPVKQQAVGVVRTCAPGGALYLRLWYSCEVDVIPPSKLPREVEVEPPDLGPTDIGRSVTVEQRSLRTTIVYTTDRSRPYDIAGFAASVTLLLAAAGGLGMVLKRAR